MSFKYRFILSFVLLEIFFITLIVSINFITINNSSSQLINDKIKSNISFLDQLIKIPVSIYDIATLDNLVENTKKDTYINSLIILDNQNRVLSNRYNYKYEDLNNLIKNKENRTYIHEDETYEIRYDEIYEEDVFIGSLFIIFDISQNTSFISKNKRNTALIIFFEIIISTILSYFIGSRLTNMLTKLSKVAEEIGDNKLVKIPFLNKKDEIGMLSKSMHQMQTDLKNRSDKLKELAVTLNKQKNDLIQAHKVKSDFLANMSHELKTPLNSINVISSIMMKDKEKKLGEKEKKSLKIINNCGNDLLYLINDVLDLSKAEAGEINLNYTKFNFHELAVEIKDIFEPQIHHKNLEFIFEFDEEISDIYSDRNRLKQIIKNLLSNAMKFVEKGSISFIVKNNQDNINIYIKDTGIGIEESKLEYIFDRFKQIDSSTTRKYSGTGLGLAICKELLDLLEGKIKVISKLGKGSIFTINIPKNINKIRTSKEKNKEKEEKTSNDILLLNTDPISFLEISIELKKLYHLIQVSDVNEFKKLNSNKTFRFAIIDTTHLSVNELRNIIEESKNKCITIFEKEIPNEIKDISYLTIKKPIDKDILLSKIKALNE